MLLPLLRFPPAPFLPPCILHTRWQNDLLELQVWSCCLSAKPSQRFPTALRERARFFTLIFKALLGCPLTTSACHWKISPAPTVVPALDAPTLLLGCVGFLQPQGLCTCCAHSLELSLQSYLHRTRTYLLILHVCFSGKPALSLPENPAPFFQHSCLG